MCKNTKQDCLFPKYKVEKRRLQLQNLSKNFYDFDLTEAEKEYSNFLSL